MCKLCSDGSLCVYPVLVLVGGFVVFVGIDEPRVRLSQVSRFCCGPLFFSD